MSLMEHLMTSFCFIPIFFLPFFFSTADAKGHLPVIPNHALLICVIRLFRIKPLLKLWSKRNISNNLRVKMIITCCRKTLQVRESLSLFVQLFIATVSILFYSIRTALVKEIQPEICTFLRLFWALVCCWLLSQLHHWQNCFCCTHKHLILSLNLECFAL